MHELEADCSMHLWDSDTVNVGLVELQLAAAVDKLKSASTR